MSSAGVEGMTICSIVFASDIYELFVSIFIHFFSQYGGWLGGAGGGGGQPGN